MNMHKTIAFVTNNYTPYSGGVVSSINATVAQLRKRGYRIYIICPNFLGNGHQDGEGVIRLPAALRFTYKQNPMVMPWRWNYHLHRVLSELKPMVVHVHHPFLLGPMAVDWAKKNRVKTVFTYHTIYEQYLHYIPLPNWLLEPIVRKRVLSFCSNVYHVVVPSGGMKKYLAAHQIDSTIVPSGIEHHFLKNPYCPKELHVPYQLLYVGRFVREKNIEMLLQLMSLLSPLFNLTLVGYGEHYDYLQRYAYEQCNLPRDRVQFVIKPDKQTIAHYYKKARLFLFPSQSDTQGLVLAESMACSTPVIALEGVGQRDIIQHGHNGFLVSDIDEMASTIMRVVADDELYSALQRNAWHTAQAYDPQKLIEQLIALYEA